VQVRPQHSAVDAIRGVQHVVMVVPVDADEDEAEHVGEKDRHERSEGAPARLVRDVEFEHHDRDDDGDYPIAERFETSLCHGRIRY